MKLFKFEESKKNCVANLWNVVKLILEPGKSGNKPQTDEERVERSPCVVEFYFENPEMSIVD